MHIISQLKLSAKLDNLRVLVDSVSRSAKQQGFHSEKIDDIALATEEALVNIMNYAYQGDVGDVEVSCMVDNDSRFIIEIEDSGIPFDGLSVDDPDITADIPKRVIGGLGIFLIKEIVDDVQYRREDIKNILKLII